MPKLISQRSEINRYIYNDKNQNKDIIEFKKLILSWVNAYVKYGEDLVDYGYKSNYVGDRMWRDYGYILYDDKDKGYNLHQKVLKKYKSIKTLFNIN
ncbi:MAG: hypothetical protein NTY74_14575 [Ignavibacteriae bacterium]|nr:hypothetical protein [Ignavibacteriota bacterium]